MPTIDKFLALWILEPQKSDYELGQPPQKGTYEISLLPDNKVNFAMNWVDQTGQAHTMSYAEIADGRLHPYETPGIADEISLTLKSDTCLESIARKNGTTVLTAARELLTADTMKVVMSGTLPDGRPYNNVSFYKRATNQKM